MTKKIAVPVDENGVLDGHFGHSKYFAFIKTEGKKIVSEEIATPPPHEPGVLPKWLADSGVTDVLSGGMGQKAIQILNHNNVNVFVGAPQITAQELTVGFLEETISFSANYCDH